MTTIRGIPPGAAARNMLGTTEILVIAAVAALLWLVKRIHRISVEFKGKERVGDDDQSDS